MTAPGIDQFGLLLHDAARLLRRRFETRGAMHGLSSAQWRLLARVAKESGATQARLAEILEIEPISVSRLVDRMEKAGWVERRPAPDDRRVRLVTPTAKAIAAYASIKAMAADVYDEALAGLDKAERAALAAALAAIIANLSQDPPARKEAEG